MLRAVVTRERQRKVGRIIFSIVPRRDDVVDINIVEVEDNALARDKALSLLLIPKPTFEFLPLLTAKLCQIKRCHSPSSKPLRSARQT